MEKRFGTALNYIDGRTQIPIIQWLKEKFSLDYIDLITEPGVDKVLSQGCCEDIYRIQNNVMISVSAHDSQVIAIAGHYDCAANPVSNNNHFQDIYSSVLRIKTWGLPVKVIGLWVNEEWSVQIVTL